MPKVSINPNSVPALAGEIAAFTSGASDNLRLDDLLTALAGVVAPGLALNCNVRLSQGLGQNIVAARTQFVEAQRTVLAGQGFTSVSDQALSAFFFSALYEELRFESTLFNERESPLLAPGGRRPRPKRRGAAYFTPPSLAYLAAHRALGAYFDG
ncbi:MAG: hypothetical protein JSS83_16695, partial [Cyanobacteria bacterium SZAS LIN-3]|nr:hypothetical protein [Cyanobacteria bacterium SZAS LIN-3]